MTVLLTANITCSYDTSEVHLRMCFTSVKDRGRIDQLQEHLQLCQPRRDMFD